MPTGFALDPDQGFGPTDELRLVKLGAELGYASAWTPSGADAAARGAGRSTPRIIQYIRTAVDPDPGLAQRTLATAAARYLGFPVYRRHFERMGVAADLQQTSASDTVPLSEIVGKIGASGKPGETRAQFERLAEGLDMPIVRILVTRRGDFDSARRALVECKPGPLVSER